jgi:glycosyltransferase involved in cell wall biosynthesis
MVLTVSNLFPRPDRPAWGMFNFELFRAFHELTRIENICLVPDWRPWRGGAIGRWQCPLPCSYPTRYVRVPHFPVVGRSWAWRLYRDRLHAEIGARSGVEAIYSTWLYPDGVAAVHVADAIGVPGWIMVQGSDTFHLESAARRGIIVAACRRAAGLVCVAEHLAERLTAAGVPAAKVHVVPNGVDTDQFRSRDRSEAWRELHRRVPGVHLDGLEGTPVILFVGNLVPVKGPDVLLSAFERLARAEPAGASLVVIGSGPLRDGLTAAIERAGLRGRVRLVGARPHDEIALWMAVADCLCLSSRSEGMPNVVLEARASGLPVVATDVGACRAMLQNDAASRIVPPGDAQALEEALVAVIRQGRRAPGEQRLQDLHSWNDQAGKILTLVRARE